MPHEKCRISFVTVGSELLMPAAGDLQGIGWLRRLPTGTLGWRRFDGLPAVHHRVGELDRNFQVIYEQANAHGAKVQTAGSTMFDTDSAVGSRWA